MDQIVIKDLEVRFRVGVPEAERAEPQRLLISVTLECDFSKAARTDDIEHTINYYEISQDLLRFGEKRRWKLIETLAVDISDLILKKYRPQKVSVEVKKFILPEARYVSVCIIRP